MRAEDRKPSKRVFPLLQNLDLDNVTFSQLQSTGNSISIEDMNEQELQDLVLVNLARLCVSSEWTGLLEAGGGGGIPFGANPGTALAGAGGNETQRTIGFHTASGSTASTGFADTTYTIASYFPFWSGPGGTMDSLTLLLETSGTEDFSFAIYSSTDDLPATRMAAQTDVDCGSAATITTDISGLSIALEEDTIYYVGIILLTNSGGDRPSLNCVSYNNHRYASSFPLTSTATEDHAINVERCSETGVTGAALPATVTTGNLISYEASISYATPKMSFIYS
jgi:hypothetical protein